MGGGLGGEGGAEGGALLVAGVVISEDVGELLVLFADLLP